MKRLNATLQWRREVKPEELVCRACAKDPRAHYCHLVGHCAQGRPVIYTCMELPNNRVYEDNRDHMIQVGWLAGEEGSGGCTPACGSRAEGVGGARLAPLPLEVLSEPLHAQTLLRRDICRTLVQTARSTPGAGAAESRGVGPRCAGAPQHAAGSASHRCRPVAGSGGNGGGRAVAAALLQTFETAIRVMPPGVEQWVWVCDFHGFSKKDVNPKMAKVGSQLGNTLQSKDSDIGHSIA